MRVQASPGWAWLLCSWVACGAALAQGQPGSVERGRYLVEGIMACGNCHAVRGSQGQPLPDKGLAGGMVFDEPPFRAVASNITPDADTGIGRWSDVQLARAVREGLRPDGSLIGPPMPVMNYRHLSDDDLQAVMAYLRSQPAVAQKVERSVYRMPLPPNYGPPLGQVSAPPRSDAVAYGRYLSEIGHCMECHTPRTPQGMLDITRLGAGGQAFRGPWGVSVSRNLTPHASGLQGWSDAQISTAVREGRDRQGQPYRPPMAFGHYRQISDADMQSLTAYLRSLPPVPAAQP